MTTYAKLIRAHVDAELSAAASAEAHERFDNAFDHLQRAHVLAQPSTTLHVSVHWQMLLWGWRRRDRREVLGQITRIVGAATKTAFGLVPAGNTGGSNVSPFQRMPVPDDLARLMRRARRR